MNEPTAGERWPDVKAYKICYRNAEGRPTLSAIIQGPHLTAEQAMSSSLVTDFMRVNFIEIYSCQPQP
jgi:hypothetical protein